MTINSQKIQRFIIAAALATGVVSAGVAASAQTTAAPTSTAIANASHVPTSTAESKTNLQAQLDELNADERRIEFRDLGTSL